MGGIINAGFHPVNQIIEVAFVLRGDVYVTSVEYKTTKQITNTPCQERTVDFSGASSTGRFNE